MQWRQFKNTDDVGWNFFVYGNNGKYDSKGYYQHFPAYLTSLT
jgi:hypothetical protein